MEATLLELYEGYSNEENLKGFLSEEEKSEWALRVKKEVIKMS